MAQAKQLPSQLPPVSQIPVRGIDLALAYETLIKAYIRIQAAKDKSSTTQSRK